MPFFEYDYINHYVIDYKAYYLATISCFHCNQNRVTRKVGIEEIWGVKKSGIVRVNTADATQMSKLKQIAVLRCNHIRHKQFLYNSFTHKILGHRKCKNGLKMDIRYGLKMVLLWRLIDNGGYANLMVAHLWLPAIYFNFQY